MNPTRSGGTPAPDGELRPIVTQHTKDIAELRQDLGEIRRSQGAMSDAMIAMRAEAAQWRINNDQKTASLQASISDLARATAVRNGVDTERNRQSEEKNRQSAERTQALKRLSIWFSILTGLLGLIGTTLFSSQTFDTAVWGHFHTHPKIESQSNALNK